MTEIINDQNFQGVDTNQAAKTKNIKTKSLLAEHLNILRYQYHLTEDTIKQARFFSCTSHDLNKHFNRKDIKSNGIVIPYSKSYFRVRFDEPLVLENGQTASYLSPLGSDLKVYVPKAVTSILDNHLVPLYLTDEEFKAEKFTQEGFYSISLNGNLGTSPNKESLSSINNLAVKNRKFYIILDSRIKEVSYEYSK